MLNVIRTENELRSDRLESEDAAVAYNQWMSTDMPFINEMCLMLLVAIRHQLERELLFIAARAGAARTITRKQYQQNVTTERLRLRQHGWKDLTARLDLTSFAAWGESMKTLHLLANCLKHEPWQQPDEELLKHLKLPVNRPEPLIVGYMPLPESNCFREGLAVSVNLQKDADYCDIAEKFVELANQFLEDVRQNTKLSRVSGRARMEFSC